MNNEQIINVGFLGAGGIAKSHAYSLDSLKYYYDDVPEINFKAVCSAREKSRQQFAMNYGFAKAVSFEDFVKADDINTVFILGPNTVHFDHFKAAIQMPTVKRIYLEKPVCANLREEEQMKGLLASTNKKVMVGFQYLQTSSVRAAFNFWKSGVLGNPIHFDLKYYHGDYLQKTYRDKRQTRLTAAPDGGAMADLGSHGISLLIAFLGNDLQMVNAMQSGNFADVPADSDLFSLISLVDPHTKAAGTLSASRVSSGSGDLVAFEIYAEKGCLRYSSRNPGYFEYFLEKTGEWTKKIVGSNYYPVTSFPSGHVPPGWLRSMVHAHYIFLSGNDQYAFIPDLEHGLAVQRIVRETADYLVRFRELKI